MAVRLARFRLALVALVCSSSVAACGLIFSPGEYAESASRPVHPDEGDAAIDNVVVPAAPDTGTPDAPSETTRLILVAGRRELLVGEPGSGYLAETMRTAVGATGELEPWSFDTSPPVATDWTRADLADGALLLQRDTTVYRATFTDSVTGEWLTLSPRGARPESAQRGWMVLGGLVSAGGFAPDAAPTTNVYRAPFDFVDAGIEPWQMITTSSLVKPRADVTLLRHGQFLYAVGGRTSTSVTAPGTDDVEVASIGADGVPGAFQVTAKLTDPTADASHGVLFPMLAAGAGWLVVAGGQITYEAETVTNVVLAAKINGTTGELGAWVALPSFPTPITSAAMIIVQRTILVFGGMSDSGLSDGVMALKILPDGTFGSEWQRIATLPGPRAGLAVAEY